MHVHNTVNLYDNLLLHFCGIKVIINVHYDYSVWLIVVT